MPPYLKSFPLGPWFATQLLLIFFSGEIPKCLVKESWCKYKKKRFSLWISRWKGLDTGTPKNQKSLLDPFEVDFEEP